MQDPREYTNKAGSTNKDMSVGYSDKDFSNMKMADAGVPETTSKKDYGKSGTGGANDGMLGKASDKSLIKSYGK